MNQSRSGMNDRARRMRAMLWSIVLMAAGAMLLPLTAYLWTAAVQANETSAQADGDGKNPRAEYWREVRESDPATRPSRVRKPIS